MGPNNKAYTIHKDLLTFYSDYFHAAFDGSFKEATEGKISLHDGSEDVFDIVNQLLYSRLLADGEGSKLSWDKLVRLWLFGDKYIIPFLQNSTMDALIKKNNTERRVPTSHVEKIWEKTLPSSPLRKFILDRTVYKMKFASFKDYEHHWTREALVDLIEAYTLKEDTEVLDLPVRDKCYYHIHKEGEEC